ncbi:hypothetical protein C5F50_02750 [Nitrosopumilus ureiphilus]|uniref:Uncharacterized protein n=1 Tax=Nitrosopumilus ureiphilus TaxID=1470067 RepID=A0A7D5R8L8_9ARCH|nr:hypothetical protein C5F50_02750 [Nitrosopumilus ureiphilus]
MPDESCRKCGGLLLDYSLCGKCKAPTRFICRICGMITTERYHISICFKIIEHDEKIIKFPLIRKWEISH